jgi:AraC family transcriptional regulator of adaptative response/methylated-DNA-[protein]-cysteine methyltransferase
MVFLTRSSQESGGRQVWQRLSCLQAKYLKGIHMNTDYERIAKAIRYIERQVDQQPDLGALAAELGLSPFHLQRLFQRWAGVSPKRFLQFLTVEYAKRLLEQSVSVLEASYASGLSSPARLHDHFIALEAVTPGEYKRQGEGLEIHYGVHPSPFGPMLLAITGRGVVWLAFVSDPATLAAELAALQRCWSGARVMEAPAATETVARHLFTPGKAYAAPLTVLVKGTNFQIQVWKALLQIPPGSLRSYEQIARVAGTAGACRAVGQVLAVNPVGYLIPCHRVIRSVGTPGGYRWDTLRKQALIAWEAAQVWGEQEERTGSCIPA